MEREPGEVTVAATDKHDRSARDEKPLLAQLTFLRWGLAGLVAGSFAALMTLVALQKSFSGISGGAITSRRSCG